MMDQYKAWHSHYITEIWRGREVTYIPVNPPVQVDLVIAPHIDAPDHYAARQMEAAAWQELNAALDWAFLNNSIGMSIHGWWLEDVREVITKEFHYTQIQSAATKLACELRAHHIWDSEADDCRRVLAALREYASAMKFLIDAEHNAYCRSIEVYETDRRDFWAKKIVPF